MTFDEVSRANVLREQLTQVKATMKVLDNGGGIKLFDGTTNTGYAQTAPLLTINNGGAGAGALRYALLDMEANIKQTLHTLGVETPNEETKNVRS